MEVYGLNIRELLQDMYIHKYYTIGASSIKIRLRMETSNVMKHCWNRSLSACFVRENENTNQFYVREILLLFVIVFAVPSC